jgi:hypothetical protein
MAKKKSAPKRTWRDAYMETQKLQEQQRELDKVLDASDEVKSLHAIQAEIHLIRLMFQHMLPGLEQYFLGTGPLTEQKAKSAAAGGK